MTDKKSVGDVVVKWHRSSFRDDRGEGRAVRARLRRCESPAEALAVAATHHLNAELKEIGCFPKPDQLALLATTFSRLRGIDGGRLAELFGKPKAKDGPRALSELRFQSLIRIHSHRGLMAPLRRSLAVLGSDAACSGRALAQDLYRWNDDVRNSWCFQYFGAGFAAANTEDTSR